jgi:hypothetical protein
MKYPSITGGACQIWLMCYGSPQHRHHKKTKFVKLPECKKPATCGCRVNPSCCTCLHPQYLSLPPEGPTVRYTPLRIARLRLGGYRMAHGLNRIVIDSTTAISLGPKHGPCNDACSGPPNLSFARWWVLFWHIHLQGLTF